MTVQIPLSKRFWAKVDKKGPDDCWLWKASLLKQGYGHILIHGSYTTTAHRASWILHFGEPPANLDVMHTCDVRSCVNPAHLVLGTPKQNSEDMVKKDRQMRGERHYLAKLSDQKVREIREAAEMGEIPASIARRFKISHPRITNILKGRAWRHVDA